jgi:hypothetical protein
LWQIEQHQELFRSAFDRRLVVDTEPVSRLGSAGSEDDLAEETVTPL